MGQLEQKIFKGKTFSSLLEEIYNNQKKKAEQISGLIAELRPLIEEIGDATLLVPLIKEYLDVGVKNDDQLVKLAVLIQRILQSQDEGDAYSISEEEKEQLLKEINNINKNNKK